MAAISSTCYTAIGDEDLLQREESLSTCEGDDDASIVSYVNVQAFVKHSGFISGGGLLLEAIMTVEEAKRKALEIEGCKGFTFTGQDSGGPLLIHFKDNSENYADARSSTSYVLQMRRMPLSAAATPQSHSRSSTPQPPANFPPQLPLSSPKLSDAARLMLHLPISIPAAAPRNAPSPPSTQRSLSTDFWRGRRSVQVPPLSCPVKNRSCFLGFGPSRHLRSFSDADASGDTPLRRNPGQRLMETDSAMRRSSEGGTPRIREARTIANSPSAVSASHLLLGPAFLPSPRKSDDQQFSQAGMLRVIKGEDQRPIIHNATKASISLNSDSVYTIPRPTSIAFVASPLRNLQGQRSYEELDLVSDAQRHSPRMHEALRTGAKAGSGSVRLKIGSAVSQQARRWAETNTAAKAEGEGALVHKVLNAVSTPRGGPLVSRALSALSRSHTMSAVGPIQSPRQLKADQVAGVGEPATFADSGGIFVYPLSARGRLQTSTVGVNANSDKYHPNKSSVRR